MELEENPGESGKARYYRTKCLVTNIGKVTEEGKSLHNSTFRISKAYFSLFIQMAGCRFFRSSPPFLLSPKTFESDYDSNTRRSK